MALAGLDAHGLEVLTEDSPIVLVLYQVANRVQTTPELRSLKPMLHDGGEEETVSEPLLMLGELLLLGSDLQIQVPLADGSSLELAVSELLSGLKLRFLDLLGDHV